MSRPKNDTRVTCIKQWEYDKKEICPFKYRLVAPIKSYGYERSLICKAECIELSYTYEVYFSLSDDQITKAYSLGSLLPLFVIDMSDLTRTNCRGDKCRHDFGPESGNWCTACHGEPEGNASMIVDLLRSDLKFGDIPSDNILYIEKKKNNESVRGYAESTIKEEIEKLEGMVKAGGGYDVMITKIEVMRQNDKDRMEELMKQLDGDN
jgi:hypothetical protein